MKLLRNKAKVYVAFAFVKPGRNDYAVHFMQDKNTDPFYLHRDLFNHRMEDVPDFFKQKVSKKKERAAFDKLTSVFAPWTEDSEKIAQSCFESDK